MTYLQVPGFLLAECPCPEVTSAIWGFVSCLAKTFKFPEPETPWPWAGDWVCFHTEERGRCVMTAAGGSPNSGRCLGWDHAGNLNCCQVGVREDHLIYPFSTQLFSVRCLSYQLTHQLWAPQPYPKYILPLLEAHIFTFTSCCVYWDVSQILSPFMTEQDRGLSLKIPQSSPRTYFVCHGSNGLGMEWHCFVPALLVISWLPLSHFICGGELTPVISVNFSFSLHKSARKHSQQRTVSLPAPGFRWAAHSSVMGNPQPTQTCLCSKIRAESLLFSALSINPNSLSKPGQKHCPPTWKPKWDTDSL